MCEVPYMLIVRAQRRNVLMKGIPKIGVHMVLPTKRILSACAVDCTLRRHVSGLNRVPYLQQLLLHIRLIHIVQAALEAHLWMCVWGGERVVVRFGVKE